VVPVPVNRAALEKLAHQTGGQALEAASESQLSAIYEDPGQSVTVEAGQVEIGDWFAVAAMVLLVLTGVGSLAWFGRPP
jgi:Ca-activated chloride channel family protein